MFRQAQQALRTLVVFLLLAVVEAKRYSKPSVEVQTWEDVAWTGGKFCLGVSPLVMVVCMLVCSRDDPEEEKLRQKKKHDFAMDGAE
mmetsp:Transcript_31436/g.68853  ORF Transcript_31436/g.68853 Transcript_31436/m.68853 type:complete len:87 (+) Transcript_31436:49-309(+)